MLVFEIIVVAPLYTLGLQPNELHKLFRLFSPPELPSKL